MVRVQAFDAARLSHDACARVRGVLPSGEDALANVSSGCKAAAPLFRWTSAQLELASAQQLAAPLIAEVARLDAELTKLQERKELAAEAAARVAAELQQLQVEEATLRVEIET